MTNKPFLFWTALALIIGVSASPCLGAEGSETPPVSLRITGNFITDADVGNGDSSVSMTSEELRLQWAMFTLAYQQTQFDWENIGSLSFGNGSDDPWERLHRFSLGAGHQGDITDKWFYHTGFSLSSTFEDEMAGSYGGAVRGGLGYKLTDYITIMAGVAVMHNPLSTSFMPNLAISYENLDKSGAGWSGRIGLPATEMSYHFDAAKALRLSVQPKGQTARLSNDSTVEQKGYVKTSTWKTGLYYDWNPSDDIRLSLGPEYHFGRKIEIYNSDKDKVVDEHIDNSWGGMFRFRYRF